VGQAAVRLDMKGVDAHASASIGHGQRACIRGKGESIGVFARASKGGEIDAAIRMAGIGSCIPQRRGRISGLHTAEPSHCCRSHNWVVGPQVSATCAESSRRNHLPDRS
jgi:hypothetical protein